MEGSSHIINVASPMSISDVVMASGKAKLNISEQDVQRLDQSRQSLVQSLRDQDLRIYGFNTGFGDNRTRPTVKQESWGEIQDNIIKSHAAGSGRPLEPRVVKAALAIRTHSLALGHSGVRGKLVKALCDYYNKGDLPEIPQYGSVGASGDLAPLSHLVLPLVERRSGVELNYELSDEFPGVVGPKSVLGPKEGLALNNGTAFMLAHLCLAISTLEYVVWHADLALAMSLEAMCGVLDAHDPRVQNLRKHSGINRVSEQLIKWLKDSNLAIRGGHGSPEALQWRSVQGIPDTVQDDYCLRSGPVIHGTAREALELARKTAEIELNSVTDNPVISDDGAILSGSHFHGMPLAFAADQLRIAMAILGGISERRISKLMNDKRNYGLPRHLVIDDENGVKSGWMIAQYSAASIVNELKTRSMPYCVGNVTTGNESEDYVSMGANACRATFELTEVLKGLVAIELASATRALLIRIGATNPDAKLKNSGLLSSTARSVIGSFIDSDIEVWHSEDRRLDTIFEKTSDLIDSQKLMSLC